MNTTTPDVDHIGVFLKYFRRRSISEQSALNYERCLQRFQMTLGKSLLEATEVDLDNLVSSFEAQTPESAPVKISTLRTYIRILRSFFSFAHNYGLIQRNPMVIISNPKQIETIPRCLTPIQMRSLLSAPIKSRPTGKRLHALLCVLYGCALRASEALWLDIEDIDLHQRTILVRRAKGGKVRGVPMPEFVRDAVMLWLEDRPPIALPSENALFVGRDGERLEYAAARLQIKWAFESMGLDGTAHWLRHSAATHMVTKGAHISFVQKFLGHSKVTTTQGYIHASSDDIRPLAGLLSA